MCKVFVNSLKGPTLTWYYEMKLGSTDSSGDLSKMFQGQFSLRMKANKKLNYLFFMLQRRDEPLRFYT